MNKKFEDKVRNPEELQFLSRFCGEGHVGLGQNQPLNHPISSPNCACFGYFANHFLADADLSRKPYSAQPMLEYMVTYASGMEETTFNP